MNNEYERLNTLISDLRRDNEIMRKQTDLGCIEYERGLEAELSTLRASHAVLEEMVLEWKRAKDWADQNPGKLIKSSMTSEEASEVMTFYFDKEKKLMELANTLKANRVNGGAS